MTRWETESRKRFFPGFENRTQRSSTSTIRRAGGSKALSKFEVHGLEHRPLHYDAEGRITERIQYNVGAQVATERSSDFEFDSHGNWIKCTVSMLPKRHGNVSFEPYMVLYRSITYF